MSESYVAILVQNRFLRLVTLRDQFMTAPELFERSQSISITTVRKKFRKTNPTPQPLIARSLLIAVHKRKKLQFAHDNAEWMKTLIFIQSIG